MPNLVALAVFCQAPISDSKQSRIQEGRRVVEILVVCLNPLVTLSLSLSLSVCVCVSRGGGWGWVGESSSVSCTLNMAPIGVCTQHAPIFAKA